ncbi:MAG TPA: transglutaminase family protein [Candidatus Dormibacteraeota bacterium]|nr:transglutaminase family protein [Candidatus Dormibacteraeota bacterium]
MRLPFGDEGDVIEGGAGVDTAAVDWTRVRRSAYVIHQRITYRYAGPVRRLRQRLVVQPREHHGDQRRVARSVRILDATPKSIRAAGDQFGNHVVDIEVPYVAEQVTFISWSVVERSTDHPHLVAGALLHDRRLLDPTALTAPDGDLGELVGELRDTGLHGDELAAAACRRVFRVMAYAHDVTSVHTTAAEAYAKRTGVCQDFAHVLLAVLRGLGLPSRYVSGQLLGSGGSHAWVEVLVPDGEGHARVLALDPTHGRSAGMTYVTIAVGRDYADIAPVSGSCVASHPGVLTMRKRVSVMRIEALDEDERLAG